jgi:arabinofuranosyltransferase
VRVVERYGEIAAAEAPVPPYRGAFLGRRSKAQRDVVAITGEVGFFGYNAGPSVHVVDMFALCDPLLARIPFEPNGRWRIGHFERPIPDGYDEVLLGRGAIRDPTIAALYDRVRLITRGPLFSAARWRAILGS